MAAMMDDFSHTAKTRLVSTMAFVSLYDKKAVTGTKEPCYYGVLTFLPQDLMIKRAHTCFLLQFDSRR